MKNEFLLAFNEMLEERGLPKEVILGAIESAMVSAYRKSVNASAAQHIEAKIDPETGVISIWAEKEVVEEVQDERTEVLLAAARKVNPEAMLNDMVVVESTPEDFGRVAAQNARQVIQQRIREAERNMQMEYFNRQVGEIVSGVVQAISAHQGITIGLDMKADGVMPNNQKIPGERFKVHDRVRAIILEVKDSNRGPQIILSRAHRKFLRRLLENEVPEIYHGIVEIRSISREPGQRAKVAVSATQDGVDPVGACVGVRGVRIQAIVRELHDEKIDIIEWNTDPVIYISKALSPARVSAVHLKENPDGGRTATVVVTEDQLSLAIGRDGQNARLAAKLTGWRIDIKSLVEAAGDAIYDLQNDAELAALAPAAVEYIPTIEDILRRKSEGRILMTEDYHSLLQFINRVDQRSVEKEEEERKVEEERIAMARAEIHPMAFETALSELPISEHVFNILTEVEYERIGDLALVLKLSPDTILGLPGIGPKTVETIEEAIAGMVYPEPELVEEEVAATVTEVEPEAEEVTAPVQPEEQEPAAQPTEQEPVAVEEAVEEIETEEEEEEDFAQSFEEMFAKAIVSSDEYRSRHEAEEEEEDSDSDSQKKKKKKKRKHVRLEYDPELDEVVAHKKHKRGSDEWDDENW